MDRLKNKVAIVTGGSVGIGRAACLRLAVEGAAVAVTDIQDDAGAAVVAEIERAGGKARFWHLDVSAETEVRRVFTAVAAAFGGVDVLVNNAGISGVDKPTHEIEEEEWDRVIAINVKGVFLSTKHAIPLLRARGGGSIVNLSSIYGLVGAADLPPYHASKGAVRLMTKNDALLYAADAIRVNSVHPGFIWTPLVEELAARSREGPDAFRRKLEALHPIGHLGAPDDVAHAIVYLASDEAKFVTGSELVVDGGYTAQ